MASFSTSANLVHGTEQRKKKKTSRDNSKKKTPCFGVSREAGGGRAGRDKRSLPVGALC